MAARAAFSAAAPDAVLLPLSPPLLRHGAGAMQALSEARIPALVMVQAALAEAEPPVGLEPGVLDAARAMRAEWSAGSGATARRAERLFGLPAGRVSVILNGADRPTSATGQRHGPRCAPRSGWARTCRSPCSRTGWTPRAGRTACRAWPWNSPGAAGGGGIACGGTGVLAATILAAAPGDHPLRLPPPGPGRVAALAGSDLLILPSWLGNLPNRFLEAVFLHVSVAAGTRALQALGEGAGLFALLVMPGNPRDMAGAMTACLDPGCPAVARLEAWRLASSWDAAAMAGRHMAVPCRAWAAPWSPDCLAGGRAIFSGTGAGKPCRAFSRCWPRRWRAAGAIRSPSPCPASPPSVCT